jgi:hypothetical protein
VTVARWSLVRLLEIIHDHEFIAMRLPFVLAVAVFGATACSRAGTANGPVAVDNFGSLNNASVDISVEGGIAALSYRYRASHDDRAFGYAQRHLCGQNCAPIDTAAGTFTPAVADSLFTIVLAQSPFSLKDDYGITGQAADMMVYTVSVTANGATKTIRADDGTMPPPVRQIVQSVRDAIAAARK